eukprot:GHVU01148367.1.p1 GENE.GHVU01148367.1~~GHVU01148367.1.p1  ORF type:complete len:117 (-),score=11.75 GHVU01148367.1:261-611(-)
MSVCVRERVCGCMRVCMRYEQARREVQREIKDKEGMYEEEQQQLPHHLGIRVRHNTQRRETHAETDTSWRCHFIHDRRMTFYHSLLGPALYRLDNQTYTHSLTQSYIDRYTSQIHS